MRNARGEVLHVRKRGTFMLMLPGGKPEPQETFAETAIREFHEELGGVLDQHLLTELGVFTADAANEPRHRVVGHVFTHPEVPIDGPGAEIEHVEWVGPAEVNDRIAPMSQRILADLA